MSGSRFVVLTCVALSTLVVLGGCRNRGGRDPGTVSCRPGAQILVACKSECGVGACDGDPVIDVCDGISSVGACSEGVGRIGTDDDDSANVCSSGGLCPAIVVTCPSSGSLTVVPRAFSASRSFTCAWDIAERGGPAPAPLVGPDAG